MKSGHPPIKNLQFMDQISRRDCDGFKGLQNRGKNVPDRFDVYR